MINKFKGREREGTRARLGNQLVTSKLMLYCTVCVQRPHKATQEEMTKFHSDDYVKFLRCIRPDNMSEYNKLMQRCECQSSMVLSLACTSPGMIILTVTKS